MDETALVQRKILNAANRAYEQNIYTYTSFLGLGELAVYAAMEKSLSFMPHESFGGSPACERQIIRFGSAELFGYEAGYPIRLIFIQPLSCKFSETLTHRDYLGALVNTGIDRGLLGDILVRSTGAYVFCMEHIADFLAGSLDNVKHTRVKCTCCDTLPDSIKPVLLPVDVIAASPRLDAVVASLTRQSRSSVLELFSQKKIYVNGRCAENNSSQLKPNDVLVIRGNGKYIFSGCGSQTRKGRICLHLQKYA